MEKKLIHIKWLEPIYFSNNITNHKAVKSKLERGAALIEYYVIVLSDKDDEELLIYPAREFKMHHMKDKEFIGVGIAKGFHAAEVLVAKIAKESYKKTGDCHLKEYLLEKANMEDLK